MTSLPPAWFIGDANLAQESQSIWHTSWVSVARTEDLVEIGSFVTASIAGDPIVVVRDRQHQLRAFGNVCPHRGSAIMHGAGTAPALQCPYHGWTFRLDGQLAAAPHMPGLDPTKYCLPLLAVEVWQGWVFVNLDPDAGSMAAELGKLNALLEPFELGSLQRVGRIESELNVNWKLVVENFAESYHHAAVHPTTLQRDFPGHKSWVLDNDDEPWMWLDHESANDEIEAFAVVLAFPSHMFSILRGIGMDWIKLEMLSATTTRLVSELFLPPDLASNTGLIDLLMSSMIEVNGEDSACLERVHAGLSSQWSRPGPVSPLEKGCAQFRRWLVDRLASTTPRDHVDTG